MSQQSLLTINKLKYRWFFVAAVSRPCREFVTPATGKKKPCQQNSDRAFDIKETSGYGYSISTLLSNVVVLSV